MDPTYAIPTAIVVAAILVFAIAFAIWRMSSALSGLQAAKVDIERRLAVEEEKASRIPGLEGSLIEKTKQVDALRDGKASTEREFATLTEALSQTRHRLEAIEKTRDEVTGKLETASTEKSDLERMLAEKTTRLEETGAFVKRLRDELELTATTLANSRSELFDLRTKHATLQETLEQVKRQAEEKLALLREAKDQMTKEFKLLAQEIMVQHGESFKRQNLEQLAGVLTPLREKLVDFQQGLQTAHNETTRERATLAEQIRTLTQASAKMTSETLNLTQALKGKSQTQGAWGEMVLKTILDQSGLREGEEYVTQESRVTEEGSRLRPDVVVMLPGGQQVVIDSKVSLAAFTGYVNAETDAEREAQLSLHLNSIRTHIKALSEKEYQQVITSELNFVIMFVPIEGALAVALQNDPALTGFATEKNVAIATPTTLMLALKTIATLWQVERRNRNADAIAERAGKLYEKFVGFLDDMKSIGERLNQAQASYAGAMDKLSGGKGNLVRQVELLKSMGAKTGKSIPPELLDSDEIEAVGTSPTGVEA